MFTVPVIREVITVDVPMLGVGNPSEPAGGHRIERHKIT